MTPEEDFRWQLHRAVDPLLDQELCHKVPNIVSHPLATYLFNLNSLRPVNLMNFPGICVAGLGKPEITEFEKLLLGEEAEQ